MSKPVHVLHNEAGDILVFASTLVWDAVAEDGLRAGASHDEALDELAGADVLLEGLVTSSTLLVLELGLALDVACRDEEVIQPTTGMLDFSAAGRRWSSRPRPAMQNRHQSLYGI